MRVYRDELEPGRPRSGGDGPGGEGGSGRGAGSSGASTRAASSAESCTARRAGRRRRRLVAHVDPGAQQPVRPEEAPALGQDREDVRLGDVLERARARDEVDGRRGRPVARASQGARYRIPKRGSSSALDPRGRPRPRTGRRATRLSAARPFRRRRSVWLTSSSRTFGRMSTSTWRSTPSARYTSGIVRSQPAPNS